MLRDYVSEAGIGRYVFSESAIMAKYNAKYTQRNICVDVLVITGLKIGNADCSRARG